MTVKLKTALMVGVKSILEYRQNVRLADMKKIEEQLDVSGLHVLLVNLVMCRNMYISEINTVIHKFNNFFYCRNP